MDINKICPGCMKELANRESLDFCPNCGYNLKNMASESHQLQPFTILAGKYLVGKVIGEGGFGISYLGLDLNLEVPLAIKEFYPNGFVTRESNNTTKVTMYAGKNESDVNHWRDSFINEARNLAKFSNLNGIVEVRDFFNENNTAYIVMEYIDGMTLKSYLKENKGKIPVDKTLEMMEPVIRSLSRVHDAGMIHRDISPDNIMITKHGGMKLLDFGAAREYAGNAEKSLSIMLKPGYAPEEQYRSRGSQGPWSDVYALCATIYKCITGKTPIESMERMREDSLQPPSALGVKMPPEQENALMKGMAVYKENRIQNMDELHACLYGSTKPAQPVSFDVKESPIKAVENSVERKQTEVQAPNAKISEVKVPLASDADKKIIAIGIGAVCGIALLVVCIVLIAGSLGKGKSTVSDTASSSSVVAIGFGETMESETDEEETIKEDTGAEDALQSVKDLIASGDYETAISTLAGMLSGDDVDGDNVKSLLQEAVQGKSSSVISEADSCASSGDYDNAYAAIDNALTYFQGYETNDAVYQYVDIQALNEKKSSLQEMQKTALLEEAQRCANSADETGVDNAFSTLATLMDSEELKEQKISIYTDLVLRVINKKKGEDEDYTSIMSYIDDHLDATGNNCWVLEFWDFFNSQTGGFNIDATVKHVSSSGYLLEDSAYMKLSTLDLMNLTQYELYLALFEIYARHGRTFNDNAVNTYFSQYSWYEPTVSYENFDDEATLNEYEKYNRDLIVNYQRQMGYR